MDADLFVDKICKLNSLDVDKLKSNNRQSPYQDIRRVVIFVLNEKYLMIPNRIKEYMNKKSHSSILKSLQVHNDLMKFNKKYRELYEVNIKIIIDGI